MVERNSEFGVRSSEFGVYSALRTPNSPLPTPYSLLPTSAVVRFCIITIALFLRLPSTLFSQQEVKIPATQPPFNEENIAKGKEVYAKRCIFCHGENGDGNGPVADYLFPRPRDFTLATFKFRTTQSGDPPLDSDLYRTISRGIPGTAMPEWGSLLSENERWQVIYYIKKAFAWDFIEGIEPKVIELSKRIPATPENIEKGKELYKKMKCFECHGEKGRGDGSSSGTLTNDWGFKIYPFNLAEAWKFKGGRRAEDVYMRFTTGVNGTPMPTFDLNLNVEERWLLAHYITSIAREEEPGSDVVIISKLIEGEIPKTPDDTKWQEVKALAIPMAGQIITKPRWQNHSITTVYVKSLYNQDEIAFRVEWDDRSKNATHDSSAVDIESLMEDTYVPASHAFEEKNLRDAISLQFPVKIPDGPEKPHFFWGQAGKKVNLWKWHADWVASRDHRKAVLEINATGYKKPFQPQADSSQAVSSQNKWRNGIWQVVMRRSLKTADTANDIQFERGKMIPIAFQAWDGSRGETDKIMSLSSWSYVTLETPMSLTAYLYGFLGLVLAGAFEFWLVRRVQGARTRTEAESETPEPAI